VVVVIVVGLFDYDNDNDNDNDNVPGISVTTVRDGVAHPVSRGGQPGRGALRGPPRLADCALRC
uniref:hypothetical protein n=1 Tax=uncultured Thiodictyon sp. TaxID=1846217 RepID=UPI0025E3ACA2